MSMSVYFSPTTKSFYPSEMKRVYEEAGTFPEDAYEVTEEEETLYFCAETPIGKTLGSVDGRPSWVDPPQKPMEEMCDEVRMQRDRLIADVEWRFRRWEDEDRLNLPHTDDIFSLTEYVQALREIPQQEGFPYKILWPVLG